MRKKLEVDLDLEYLRLPSRYEVLAKEINDKELSVNQIVHEVESARVEVQSLLKQLKYNKLGRFKIFYGVSGAGKTTFLKTLPSFFNGVAVIPISRKVSLNEIPSFIENEKSDDLDSIFLMEDRDNPNESDEDLRIFFEEIRVLFRQPEGKIIIIWPITDYASAQSIGKIAWDVGRDSITNSENSIFKFNGLDKKFFYEVADITSKNINGLNLESFGVTEKETKKILKNSSTIGEYFSKLESLSIDISAESDIFLKK
jgi:hypothetical protein